MPKCDTCGNDYDQAFQVIMGGNTHYFDCFQCAIQMLAPACADCGCTIIGHGTEAGGEIYCCHHCARHGNAPPVSEQDTGEGVIVAPTPASSAGSK